MKKMLLEFLPLILFWSIYQLAKRYAPIPSDALYYATAAAMVGAVGQITWLWLRKQAISNMIWLSFGLIMVFGSTTLILHNDLFIKLKFSILYGLFASALLLSQWLWKKNLIYSMMGEQLQLPAPIWVQLNYAWATFFLVLGALNVYVVYHASNDTWINFKTWGSMGASFAFIVCQMIWLSRHIQASEIPHTNTKEAP